MTLKTCAIGLGAAALTTTLFAAPALASAPLLECPGGGYGTSLLASFSGDLDDGSIPISISEVFPSGMNVLGVLFTDAWVNINGNITFENPLSDYTPDAIPGLTQPTIAPYFADVDMRSGQGGIYFCSDPANQRVLITWENVGYYSAQADKLNSFQVVLRNTAGQCAAADTYDVQFRYNRLEWTTGDFSGGAGGLGGTPAVGGIDAGDTNNAVAVPGSGTGAMLDLVNLTNTDVPGVFEYKVADGQLPTCGDGVVDVCEECDGGPGCTPQCLFNVCGDGFLDPDSEQCDGDQFLNGTPSCPAGYTGTPLCNNDPANAQGDGTCTLSPVPGGCVNIDECAETPGICGEGECSDTPGSYACDCDAGYAFDGTTCVNIDECTETPEICGEGECSDSPGSYACDCDAGYLFDGTTCVNIDECAETPGICGEGECSDTPGSYACDCDAGYAFDGTTCVNIDECTETPEICGEGECSDTPGSYSCDCEAGYAFDGTTCVDVDECAQTPGICGEGGSCTNTAGGYACTCAPGYELIDGACADIDECAEDASICGPGACSNLGGSYSCTCDEGYAFDGESCVNIDECAETPGICGPGQCSDADGSYSCACDEGYAFDGQSCANVDECALGTDSCHAQASCADTQGSFTCTCLPGFVGDGELCTAQVGIVEPADETVTNETTPTFSGVGEPGSEISMTIDGDVIATVTVESNGEWSVTLTEALDDGQYEIIADDGRSTDTIILVIDTVAPVLSVDSPEQGVRYAQSPGRVEGQAEPGDDIEIIINDEIVGTTVADENGAFRVELDEALEEGVYELRVTATDEAGNTSEEVVDFSVDSSEGVRIDAPAEGERVRTSTPTLSGSAEPGVTVTLLVDGQEVGQTVADDQGQWSFTLSEALDDGDYVLGAAVDSPSGVRLDQVEVTIDTSTTSVIIDSPADGTLTAEANPEVSGSAAPGATLTIIIDGEEIAQVEADANGQWSYTPSEALQEGSHVIEVVAEDDGVITRAQVAIDVDLSAPQLAIDTPAEGQILYDDERSIRGSAEPGSVIVVELDGEVIETLVVGDDGQWSVDLPEDVPPGDHQIVVTARDEAGNSTSEQRQFEVAERLMMGGGGNVLGGCTTAPTQGQAPLWLFAAAGVLVWRRRRRV